MIEMLLNDVVVFSLACVWGMIFLKRTTKSEKELHEQVQKQSMRANRNAQIISYFDIFLRAKQEKRSFSTWFQNKKIESIAIYGFGFLGERLCDELRAEKNVEVKYLIDRNAANKEYDIPVLGLDDEWAPVDAIVIAVVGNYDMIKNSVFKDIECDTINIEDYLNDLVDKGKLR